MYCTRARVCACVPIVMYARFIISNIPFYCEIESLKTRIKHDLLSPSYTLLLILYASTKFFDFYNYTRVTVRVLHVVNTRIIKYQNEITDYKERLSNLPTDDKTPNIYCVQCKFDREPIVYRSRCLFTVYRHMVRTSASAQNRKVLALYLTITRSFICEFFFFFYHSSRSYW